MRMSSRLIPSLIKGALLAALAAGTMSCEADPPTVPSGTGAPAIETFSGTLQPGGDAFYSFSMPKAGVVSLTLTSMTGPVSYTHLRAHETPEHLVCRLL